MWSVLAGMGGGWAFYCLWRRLMPRERSRAFWQAMPAHANGIVSSEDPADVLRHYKLLLRHAGSFGLRNTLAVAAGLVPLVALFLLADAVHAPDRRSATAELRPAAAIAGLPAAERGTATPGGGLEFDRRMFRGSTLELPGASLGEDALAGKHAFCAGPLACLGYAMLLFDTHPLPAGGESFVLRPPVLDANPWWPYLDDLELAFMVSAAMAALIAGWLYSRTGSVPKWTSDPPTIS